MPFLSLTRLRLRGWLKLPRFMLHASRSRRQAESAQGFIGGALSGDPPRLTFWTATVWESEAAMRAFLVSSPHREAMLVLGELCEEASVAHLERESDQVPDGADAVIIMEDVGRVLRLPRPSAGHAAGDPVPDGRPPWFARRLRKR